MSDDLLITPGSRKMEFKDSSANVDAKIETDSSGNLIITNTGGDISIGDTTSDIFVGDGTANVDIVFEQAGEIRGTTGVTVTLGASDSNIRMATDLNLNSNDITNVGDLTVTNLTVSGTTTTVNSTNTTIADSIIELNSGLTGANSKDIGFIFERGSTGNNAGFVWDESADRFTVFTTTDTASSDTVDTSSVANFQAGSFYGNGANLTSLNASNLGSGTVPSARLSLSASDIPSLAASKITSGTFADARIAASSITQHTDPKYLRSDTNDTYTGTLSVAGTIQDSGDSRRIHYMYGTTSSQPAFGLGEQGLYGMKMRWDSSSSIEFDGFWNSSVTGARNRDLGSINVNSRIWYLPALTMEGTLTMGSNTLTGSNFNISGVNALTINDPGEGIIFTGTNTVSLYAVDDAADNIMKFDGAAKLLVSNNEVYHEGHKPTYSELGTMAYSNLTGTPTIPTNNNQLTNGAGYITSSGNTSGTAGGLSGTPDISVGNIFVGSTSGAVASLGEAGIVINTSTKPQILFDGGGDSNLDIAVPTGEILQIGHWDVSANSATLQMSMETDGDFSFEGNNIQGINNVSATTITSSSDITITGDSTQLRFTGTGGPFGLEFGDTENNPNFRVYYRTSPNTLTFENNGETAKHTFDLSGNYTATGNITVSGTVDGRDVATDGTKLDTIATNADVTPSWVPSSNPNYLTGNQTITLSGDVSGSGTTSISVTVADDSHNHIISNVDGLQTALDAKLASSSYTASDVLTKIKTVDGSSSGLDADLLDGYHGDRYHRSALSTFTSGNWNNLTTHGTVKIQHSNFNSDTNPPPASYAYGIAEILEAEVGGENRTLQIYYPHSTGDRNHYIRMFNSSSWTDWRTVPHTVSGAQTVWHSNNDGANSGLDADLLDAQHGSYYLNYNNFTNTPTIPSLSGYATESYVTTQINNLIDSAPGALNTLNELAAAIGDDANFSTTVTNSIAAKLPLAGGTMTGSINLNGSNLTGINYLQFENEELTTMSAAYQMVVDANDTDSNVPNHGDTTGSGPFGIYFTGDNGGSTTTLGSGLVKVWHTGHFKKAHIDYFVGLYNTGVTTTEFDYLDGVTSNIQTQLNSKQASGSYLTGNQTITLSGDVSGSGTTSISVTVADDSHNHVISNVDGLQSALDAKAPTANPDFTGTADFGLITVDTNGGTSSVADEFRIGADNYATGTAFSGVTIRPSDGVNPDSGGTLLMVRSGGGSPRWFVQHSGRCGTSNSDIYVSTGTDMTGGNRVFHDGYHPNADTLTTARTIAGTSFNGSANIDISYNNLTNKPTIPTNNNQLTNGAGYITSSGNTSGTAGGLSGTPSISVSQVTVGTTVINSSTGIAAETVTHYLGGIKIAAENASQNYIAFAGTTGDAPGEYSHSYIGERIWSSTEKSELVVAKFNDVGNTSGPDRVRLIGNELVFDTYSGTTTPANDASLSTAVGTGTISTRMTIGSTGIVTIGDGSNTAAALQIKAGDDDGSDHIQFYNGTTRVGEIGCGDDSWLRINQTTAKNIYTPRYFRADGGLFVINTNYGINSSGRLTDASLSGTYSLDLTFSGTTRFNGDVGLDYAGAPNNSKFHVSGGKMSIVSTDNSYGQLQVGNTTAGEVSIGFMGGVTESTIGNSVPTSTYKWAAGLNVYGCGANSFGIGNAGDAHEVFRLDAGSKMILGHDGDNPNLKLVWDDNHANGDRWDTIVELGRLQDRHNGSGNYPTYQTANGYGLYMQSTSDGCFYGMEEYSTNNFRPVIAWGDDSTDSPFFIRYNNSAEFAFTYNGVFHADDDIIAFSTTTSDARYKDNVSTIENALDKVQKLRGVEFDWNATSRKGEHDIGFIAQEIEQVIPEVVSEQEMLVGEFEGKDEKAKTVAYGQVTALLVEAIKEQQETINKLIDRIDSLEKGE